MIKLIKSTFYNEEKTKKELLKFIEKSNKLSMGEQVMKFEKKFSEKQNRKFSVFVNSGSSANLLLVQALLNLKLLKKGDKVGFSALTWPTNVMPLLQLGLKPVPIDCELDTLNVSSKKLKEKIKDLDAFFLTNALGFAHDPDKIRKLCDQNEVILIEDNAESLGTKYKGELLGNFGLASTFSFFVGHHISTIEGGMISTNNKDLYDALVISRSHGWDRHLDKKKRNKLREKFNINDFYGKYSFYNLGFNLRSTEINAFIGNTQLQYWDEIISKRQDNFNKTNKIISENKDLYSLKVDHLDIISNFAVPVIVKSKDKLKEYKEKFIENGVEIRPIIAGDMTNQPFYIENTDDSCTCKNANIIHQQGFYFGNNPEMTSEEIEVLIELLK